MLSKLQLGQARLCGGRFGRPLTVLHMPAGQSSVTVAEENGGDSCSNKMDHPEQDHLVDKISKLV